MRLFVEAQADYSGESNIKGVGWPLHRMTQLYSLPITEKQKQKEKRIKEREIAIWQDQRQCKLSLVDGTAPHLQMHHHHTAI